GGDEVRESEGESEEEEETSEKEEGSFDLIPRTPEDSEAPILPPTIPSIILENLPTFNSVFRFEERLRLLETSFSEYRQTNQFADA
nr:hypothetical protein [Tanacetum cinerariifolium]